MLLRGLLFVAAICLLWGCSQSDGPTGPQDPTTPSHNLLISVSWEALAPLGHDITAAAATLTPTGAGAPLDLSLTLAGTRATGTVSDLPPGDYTVTTSLRSGVPVLARLAASHTQVEGRPDTLQFSIPASSELFPDLPRKVVFVGNSLTAYNGGIGLLFPEFVAGTDLGIAVTSTQLTMGGFTLENHWTDLNLDTQAYLATADYDHVVLQGSPSNMVNNPASFTEYAPRHMDLITGRGAVAGLFIPPSYEDYPQHAEGLVQLCEDAAASRSALLIPINQAYYYVLEDNSTVPLFAEDGSHPSPYGTYLYMCVIYSALFQTSPVGCTFDLEEPLGAYYRQYLQEAAWTVTSEYLGWQDAGR